MGKVRSRLFGYSKKEVEEIVCSLNLMLETAEKNVEYLAGRVEELETKLAKYEKSKDKQTWHLEKDVASGIQKTLEIDG